jgi:hypothetical protein
MIVLRFSKQGEHIFNILMASVLCVHFSQLVDRCVTQHAPHNTIEHTHVKILVSASEDT